MSTASGSQQTGNGGIIHDSSTLGGEGTASTGTSSGGVSKATGWAAGVLGGAGMALALV